MACAAHERTSGFEPSSETITPRYLKLVTVLSFCPLTLIFLWMPLALFVISFVCLLLHLSLFYTVCRLCRAFQLGLPGPEVMKLFSCSTQVSMKFFLLINVKMPTIVGILTFLSGKNSTLGLSEPKKGRIS